MTVYIFFQPVFPPKSYFRYVLYLACFGENIFVRLVNSIKCLIKYNLHSSEGTRFFSEHCYSSDSFHGQHMAPTVSHARLYIFGEGIKAIWTKQSEDVNCCIIIILDLGLGSVY